MTSTCFVAHHAGRAPGSLALEFEGRSWSYAALNASVSEWQRLLLGRGVTEGDRVAVLSPNRPELVFLIHALARIGATLVPLNARLTAVELAPLVERAAPKLVLADEAISNRLPSALSFSELQSETRPTSSAETNVVKAVVRCILFTSGTTGVPKGAELTTENFVANARATAENLGAEPTQRWLGCLPLFHVGGIALVTRAAQLGGAVILQRAFEARASAELIARHRITHASLVPTALRRMMTLTEFDPRSLKAILIGGGPVPRELLHEARARGLPCLETYGLTEAASQVATERLERPNGLVALESTRVQIVDADKQPVAAGVVGEIAVRGPTVMRGYFGQPPITDWLYTGDIGELDATGRLTVHARRTDLIVTGGENVYPAEIEAAISAHPQVTDVAVTSLDDPEWGQTVVAVFTGSTDGQTLEAHCRARLAGFKVPRRFHSVDAIPRNANGKVDRIALRNLVQKFR